MALTADQKRLFVSCGNRNVVSVIDTRGRQVAEQIDVAVVPKAPLGCTPNALVLTADNKTLLVANADNNAVAVIDVAEPGRSQPKGFLPTGWYPTALCLVDGGRKLLVANGKGSVSGPNRLVDKEAKLPGEQELSGRHFGYIPTLLPGSLSLVEMPDPKALADYSQTDLHDDPVAFSKGGFLWDLCAAAGISYRSYGEFARIRGAEPGKVRAAMPCLEGHIHPTYFGADGIAQMSDTRRLELWLEEFRRFEARGEMPRFTVLSLPGDHPSRRRRQRCRPSPRPSPPNTSIAQVEGSGVLNMASKCARMAAALRASP